MPNFLRSFRYGVPTNSHREQFLRRVGLTPLVGPIPLDRVVAATQRVQWAWRSRVSRAAAWELPPFCLGSKWRMLNCPPAFVFTTTAGLPCNWTTICPFCWSRTAYSLWQRIDQRLFGALATGAIVTPPLEPQHTRVLEFEPPAEPSFELRRDDLTMIVRKIRYTVRDGRPSRIIAERLAQRGADRRRSGAMMPSRNRELERFRGAGILGGLDTTLIRTVRQSDDALPGGFHVEFRQVMFCRPALAAEVMRNPYLCVSPEAPTAECVLAPLQAVPAPSRKQVMEEIAGACRYPRALMTGDREVMKRLLAVHGKVVRRLTTCFGGLYGRASIPFTAGNDMTTTAKPKARKQKSVLQVLCDVQNGDKDVDMVDKLFAACGYLDRIAAASIGLEQYVAESNRLHAKTHDWQNVDDSLEFCHVVQLMSFCRHLEQQSGEQIGIEDMLAMVATYIDEHSLALPASQRGDGRPASLLDWLFATFELERPDDLAFIMPDDELLSRLVILAGTLAVAPPGKAN